MVNINQSLYRLLKEEYCGQHSSINHYTGYLKKSIVVNINQSLYRLLKEEYCGQHKSIIIQVT